MPRRNMLVARFVPVPGTRKETEADRKPGTLYIIPATPDDGESPLKLWHTGVFLT